MKKFLIALIDFYRHQISPYKGGACCRFVPTCSQYAREAIEKYGALYGTYLAVRRILRCHPFHKGGYDPVPDKHKGSGEEKIRHMFEYLITRPMGFIIEHIYNLVPNYGLAIIIFTILIKLILIPLNIHSQKAMKKQQKKYSR